MKYINIIIQGYILWTILIYTSMVMLVKLVYEVWLVEIEEGQS